MSGAVAHVERYKKGFFFSQDFVGTNSWNGYERNCLFANLGSKAPDRFSDIARPAGAAGQADGRAVAVADLDRDGGLDLVVANNGGPPTVYRNRLAADRHWVRFRLGSQRSNGHAVGARLALTAGGVTQTRWVEAGSGYAAQSPYAVHFGLGDATDLEALEIAWPSGLTERYDRQALGALGGVDQEIPLLEGSLESPEVATR